MSRRLSVPPCSVRPYQAGTVIALALAVTLAGACSADSTSLPDIGGANGTPDGTTDTQSTEQGSTDPLGSNASNPGELQPGDTNSELPVDGGESSEQSVAGSGEPSTDNETDNSTDAGSDADADVGIDVDGNIEPVACGPIDRGERLQMLELVNDTRATARQCGNDWYPATGTLSWDDRLEAAASIHSNDLATHDIFSHTGTDGSSISDRVTTQGYRWNRIGENIAAGQRSFATAMQGWINSPRHCRNIMQPDYTNIGIACVNQESIEYGTYWTQVFGNER